MPVSVFVSQDYLFRLEAGDLVEVKVAAHNLNGWGDFSEVNIVGAQIETVPGQLLAPTRNAETNTIQIVVDWQPPTNDGFSDIVSYNLQWDSGSEGATWTNLIGFNTESLAQTYTVAQGVAFGDQYRFKVRAKNYWGWSDFSESLVIKSATYPDPMVPLTTEVDAATGDVKFSWIAPYNNEQEITAYEILINDINGDQWHAEDTYCNGSLQGIVSALYCQIPMAVFIEEPYNLDFRTLIKAKARAYNVYGWQVDYSEPNSVGVAVRREPRKMGTISVDAV